MNPTEQGEFWLRQKDIEQRLLTIDLEQKRQWYGRQPDPPLVPPDWLGFTGEASTTTPSSSSTTTTTTSSTSSTTTSEGTCPSCLAVIVGAAEYESVEVYPEETILIAGGSGVFGGGDCSYGGGVGENIYSVGAAPNRGDPTDDWHVGVAWNPYPPEGSPGYESAQYAKPGPNTGPLGTYTKFRESPLGNLTYPTTVEVVGCGSTSTTTTTTSSTSSTTTTLACTGGILWVSNGSDWVDSNHPSYQGCTGTCESGYDCVAPKPSFTADYGTYIPVNCDCAASPTTTTTTTSSTSSTTTTAACEGGTGSHVWNCSGGTWMEEADDGTCAQPSIPAEYVPCVDATQLVYTCATCSWSLS